DVQHDSRAIHRELASHGKRSIFEHDSTRTADRIPLEVDVAVEKQHVRSAGHVVEALGCIRDVVEHDHDVRLCPRGCSRIVDVGNEEALNALAHAAYAVV